MSTILLFLAVFLFAAAVTIAAAIDYIRHCEAMHWQRVSTALITRLQARGAIVTFNSSQDNCPIEIIWPDEQHPRPIDSAIIVE